VTILLRRGVPPHHVQRIARHAKLETTLGIYGHLDVDDLRAAAEMVAAPAATVTPIAVKLAPKEPHEISVKKKAGPTGGLPQ
jgi:hypothetical protein